MSPSGSGSLPTVQRRGASSTSSSASASSSSSRGSYARTPTFRELAVQSMLVPRFLDSCFPRRMGNIYILWRAKQRERNIVLGPHWPGVLVTICLILGGTALNLQLVDIKLSKTSQGGMVPLVYFLCALTVFLLLKTATTDPGIIYCHSDQGDIEVPDISIGMNTMNTTVGTSHASGADDGTSSPEATLAQAHHPLVHKSIELGTGTGTVAEGDSSLARSGSSSLISEDDIFCDECDMYVPDRLNSRHCYDCDACLEGMDHHCPWMGMCVARGNMRFFVAFNVCWALYLAELLMLAFWV